MASELVPAKRLCGATRTRGDKSPCTRPAGWGTSHAGFGTCKWHGGCTPSSSKHAEGERALWQQTLIDEMDPALAAVKRIAHGDDVPYRDQLKALTWLVEQARTIAEGQGAHLSITLRWPPGM